MFYFTTLWEKVQWSWLQFAFSPAECYNTPAGFLEVQLVKRIRSARRLWILALLTLAGLAGFLVDLFLLGPVADFPPAAPRFPRTIPNTDVDPFGVNIFLDREVNDWKLRRTIEMIDQAGIDWVKQQFSWAEIEPRQGYFWDDRYDKSSWAKFDRIVELAEEYGLHVIARLDRPPEWARAPGSNPQAPPLDPHTYAAFVKTFVEHYRGRIHYIQIWNEPNLHNEWQIDAPVDPDAYVTLLRLAYQAAKEADPNIQVLCAPLAIQSEDDPNRLYVSELTFLEEMYQAGAAPYFDIMSANAYGVNSPPEEPPDPSRYNFRRVELLRMVMDEYGDANKAVWFNEYGWNAAPADVPAQWGRVTDQQQAQWTVEGIAYAQEHWPWAGVISIWYFRQGGEIPADSAEYYFRMVNVDFTPLPVYYAVKEAATALRTAGPGWYEETSPPILRRGDWEPIYTSTVSAGAYLLANEPASRIELAFQGSDLTLRVRRGPDGGQLIVWVDGNPTPGTILPRNANGQTYLDLYSAQEEWLDVPLVQGLGKEFPAQRHRLELAVAEEKTSDSQGHACAIDGFTVAYDRSFNLFWVTAGLLLTLTLAMAISLFVEARRPRPPRPPRHPVNPWTVRAEEDPSEENPTAD